MRSRQLTSVALLASCLVGSQAASVLTKRNSSCEDVKINQLRDPERSKEIWEETRAGQLGDEFISNNGLEYWIQNFDQEIFQDDVSDKWDCTGWETKCELEKECSEYPEPGQYFLYYSLQQFRTFTKSFHERLQDDTIRQTLEIFKVQGDFEWHDDSDLNVPVIIAGALGIMGGIGAAIPVIGGLMALAAGVSVIVGNANPPKDSVPDTGDSQLGDHVQSAFEQLRDAIGKIDGAVLGNPGYGPDLIPPETETGTKWASPAMGVLGDGRWLRTDPTEGLTGLMDQMFSRMRQALAWAMMRYARHAFVFIDQPVEKHECGTEYHAGVWDPDEGFCFRLFHVNDKGLPEPVHDELADKLWSSPYNIDKLEAYRNAYRCWLDNDGQAGDTSFVNNLEGDLPPCWFSMVVVKGTYLFFSKSRRAIKTSKSDFPGQGLDTFWEETW